MLDRTSLLSQIDSVVEQLGGLVQLLSHEIVAAPITDALAAEAIDAVEAAGRLMDGARVRAIAPLVTDVALAERLGYASPVAAVAAIARISERSARARLRVASAVSPDMSMTGAHLPAPHPIVGDALDSGQIGLDAAALVATELGSLEGRIPVDVLQVAEMVMVRLAAGVSADGEAMVSTVSVDYLAGEIRQVTATVDPDGTRPQEDRAKRRRDFRVGAPDEDGLVPAYGRLMPEIGSLLLGLLEAHRRSPRFVESAVGASGSGGLSSAVGILGSECLLGEDGPAASADSRTPGQLRHDALAEILIATANTDGVPRLDGAPVSVLVTVSASVLSDPHGTDNEPIGAMAGSTFLVSRRTIERFIDAGGFRVVTVDENGATTGISSPQRCFTSTQRLGIAARDGYRCSTPGCTSPHFTLQAHHVIPDRDDGPTAVGNGILLCYWHHQIVDTGPWRYRMVSGIPQVRGPSIREWTPTRTAVGRDPLRRVA